MLSKESLEFEELLFPPKSTEEEDLRTEVLNTLEELFPGECEDFSVYNLLTAAITEVIELLKEGLSNLSASVCVLYKDQCFCINKEIFGSYRFFEWNDKRGDYTVLYDGYTLEKAICSWVLSLELNLTEVLK